MRKNNDEKLPWRDEPRAFEDVVAGIVFFLVYAALVVLAWRVAPDYLDQWIPDVIMAIGLPIAAAFAEARRKGRFEERAQRMIEVLVAEAPLEPKDIAARIGSDDIARVRITAARLARDGILQRTPDGYRPAA